ncbi:MAG TPA: peptidoglycan-binding protein [Coleofasciculaceae cyanobacterium]
METFAYLQVAQDYENPESKELVFLKDGLSMFRSLSGMKLPSQTLFILLGVASSAFILNIANAAQAALYRGDSGPDVTYLQNLLNNNGYSVPVTGYYGSQTESQVINYQSNYGLVADGVAGSSTLSALEGGFVPVRPDGGSSSTLRYGDSGSGVTNLQYLLNDKGYFSGPYTGYFGSSTEQAVINFQSAAGLTADGIAGPATLSALQNGGFVPISPGGGSSGVYYPGDQGEAVSNIQRLLNDQGYPVAVTGYYGSVTEQQVRNFQYDNYLTADGVAGPSTLDALNGGTNFQPVRPGGSVFQLGDSGVGVRSIQQFLSSRGYYTGSIDGVFGYGTYDAVVAYQRDIGISADGIWGPQTGDGVALARS